MTTETRPMPQATAEGSPPPRRRRILSYRALYGYGPLVAFVVLIGLMMSLLPSVVREDETVPEEETTRSAEELGLTPGSEGTEGREGTEGTSGRVQTLPAQTTGCPNRERQIPGDPYSPACIAFSGDNGGATARGVTDSEIIISARILNERGFQQTLATLAGAEITDQPPDVMRTISAFQDYLNERFQFYGRKMKIVFYQGKGSNTDELLGGGQAEAQADAIHVAQNIKAFAEMNATSAPFQEALARQKVMGFGTPYLSRQWHVDHRPYSWGIAPDCDTVAEAAAEIYAKQMAGKPAQFAGPGLQGKMRIPAGLSPENPWYQVCHDSAIRLIEDAGHDPGIKINYRLDIPSFSNQAANIVARLKNDGITTILCGCDPVFPVFLSAKAAEQEYYPEWIVLGTAGTDLDIVGQLYNQDQWSRAFGVSHLGEQRPQRAGLGYAAYKTVRDDEPAFAAELIYAQMYMIALGLQLAGPNLTHESFERGIFTYTPQTGPFGTWTFGPSDYTPPFDTRYIWWNPDKVSIFNGKPGAYEESYGGRRFAPGQIPAGDPQVFGR